MVGSLERGRAHGPATRATAHTQQRARSRGRARPEQRTGHGLDGAPLTAHLLEVLEEPRRLVLVTDARPHADTGLRTEFCAHVVNDSVGQGMSRERGAQGVALRVHRVTHPYRRPVTRLQPLERLDGGAGRDDYRPAEKCFSSACVGQNGVRVGLKREGKSDSLQEYRVARPTPCRLAPALNRVGLNWRAHEGALPRLTPACPSERRHARGPPKGTQKMGYPHV